MKNIDIHIQKIETTMLAVNGYIPDEDGISVSMDASIVIEAQEENKLLNIILAISLHGQQAGEDTFPLANITTEHSFYLPDWEKQVKIEDDVLTIEHAIETRLLRAAYSCTRGILATKTADTPLSRLYLPLVEIDGASVTKKSRKTGKKN